VPVLEDDIVVLSFVVLDEGAPRAVDFVVLWWE
jgi:hypothetical protein